MDTDYWTNREALEAKSLPGSMVVLGGGPIGLELAQSYSRLGTKISVVEMGDHALPAEEPENSKAMDTVLWEEGIELHAGVSADRVSNVPDGGVSVHLSDGSSLEGDRVLVAVGRRYDLTGLGIGQAGLDEDAHFIETDDHLRAGDGIWAVGDITGKGAFTHMATYQARIAAAAILGREHAAADYRAIPRVTFTDPEVASVGLSERQAGEQGIEIKMGVAETASSTRGWIHGPGARHGVTKLIADTGSGVLIGGSTMGPAAGEVLGLLILAIKERIPVASLRELIYPYPTFVRGLEDALSQLA
jgi:pyruvate/2-oxoglutarate dehydrogenase complex dihydrolipoamide dehydrogenase (E3) component